MQAIRQPLAEAHPGSEQPDEVLCISTPTEELLRARSVISRSRARRTTKYPSLKAGRMLHAESQGELDAFRRADADPNVLQISEQPLAITFRLDGKVHKHIPDILVEERTRRSLWEIKSGRALLDEFVLRRTRLLQSKLPRYGYSYILLSDEEVRSEPAFGNALLLLRHAAREVLREDWEQARRALSNGRTLSWESILAGALGDAGPGVISRLAICGDVIFDTASPVSGTTKFWFNPEGSSNL